MNTERMPITSQGFSNLQEELKKLKTIDRIQVIQAIKSARAHGDLSENAEYHAACEKQSFIEGRIAEIEDKISRAEVINVCKLTGPSIKFGATITIQDQETEKVLKYQIVGESEADINKGLLSIKAPLSRALINKQKNDIVEVSTPNGFKSYEIISVEYK